MRRFEMIDLGDVLRRMRQLERDALAMSQVGKRRPLIGATYSVVSSGEIAEFCLTSVILALLIVAMRPMFTRA